MLTATVTWQGGMAFEGSTGSGHNLVVDAKPDVGGENRGPRPKEVLLVALGTCTGMDVVSILRKMRAAFDGFAVVMEADDAPEHPRVLQEVRMVYRAWGPGVSPEQVERAVRLSLDRYCGVANTINRVARLTWSYEVNGRRFDGGSVGPVPTAGG